MHNTKRNSMCLIQIEINCLIFKRQKHLKPGIHIATDCNAPSQVQSQVSETGAHTRCDDLQRNWPVRPHRRKNKWCKTCFHGFLYLQLATPRHTPCEDLQHDDPSKEISDTVRYLRLSATGCNWPPYTLQLTATRCRVAISCYVYAGLKLLMICREPILLSFHLTIFLIVYFFQKEVNICRMLSIN